MIETSEMLKIFQPYRGDAIVVPGKAAPQWDAISTLPNRDIPIIPNTAMGGRAAFAFGLALAQPDTKVVLFDTEGDLLMALNILPTVGEHKPRNFYHFLLDNECYATTGGQPVPNAKGTCYDMMARGAGYSHTFSYDNLETFAVNIERVMSLPGPVFVALKVIPVVENEPIGRRKRFTPSRSRPQMIKDLQRDLGIIR